jgi:hypothetical protein
MPKIGRPARLGRHELLMAESFLNWQAGPSNVGIWVKLASARTVINESEMERMRGADSFTESVFTVLKLDDFVPHDHPLRASRPWLNDALKRMDDVVARMYEADVHLERVAWFAGRCVRAR